MSGPEGDPAAAVDPEGVVALPMTGQVAVDEALLGLAELASTPLPDHHDQLARAHERLHDALHTDTGNGPAPRR